MFRQILPPIRHHCLNLEAIRLIGKSLRGAAANEAGGCEGMALGLIRQFM